MDTLTQIIINMALTTPSDADLGKKIRALVREMGHDTLNEGKQIIKG